MARELLPGLPFPSDSYEHAHRRQESMRMSIYRDQYEGSRVASLAVQSTKIFDLKAIKTRKPISVFVVDGTKVRSVIDIDFTCGGHEFRYLYIPKNEIWIDHVLRGLDRDATVVHEYIERELMRRGVDYNQAHDHASKYEMLFRDHLQGAARTDQNSDTIQWMNNIFPCIRDSMRC